MIDDMYNAHKNKIVSDEKNVKSILNEITNKIDKLTRKSDKLLESYTEGIIKKEQFTRQNDDIETSLKELEEEKKILSNRLLNADNLQKKYIEFKKGIEQLRDIENWTNGLLKMFFPRILVYDRENIEIKISIQEEEFQHSIVYKCKKTKVGTLN